MQSISLSGGISFFLNGGLFNSIQCRGASLALFFLQELIKALPVLAFALFLEVDVENALFFLLKVSFAHDGFVTLLDDVHIAGIRGQSSIVD